MAPFLFRAQADGRRALTSLRHDRRGDRPLTLAPVLDRSDSMGGHKLAVARSCPLWLAECLASSGRMVLVAFDHEVTVLAVPGERLDRVASALRLQDGDGPRRVSLLTDGLANQGIVDPERMTGQERRARNGPV